MVKNTKNDILRLIHIIDWNYDADWVKTSEITKTDNGKTIIIKDEDHFLLLNLNNKNTILNLKIDTGKTDTFIVKTEKDKLNIYNKTDLNNKVLIISCCGLLLNFVYDTCEKGRRQALSTMLEVLENSQHVENPDESFREAISNYFKRTYSKQLINVAEAKDLSELKSQIIELLDDSNQSDLLIKPVTDFKSLKSQINRTMEDFPESIGLFLLRAYVRLRINETDDNQIFNDINQFLSLSFNNRLAKEEVYPLLSWLLIEMVKIRNIRGRSISKGLINKLKDDDLTIQLIKDFDKDEISDYGKMVLLKKIYKDLEDNFYGR
jgi:hypothetical protein